jgi:phage RecT family recombinase
MTTAPRQSSSRLARPDQPELTNAVATRDPNAPVPFREARDKFIGQLDQHVIQAIGKNMDPTQFQRSLATVITENPDLLRANQTSLAVAVLHAARLGLDLTPSLQLAYLTTFNVRKQVDGNWLSIPMVKMMIGYKGFVLLGRRSGLTDKVDARTVYAKDMFDWEEGTSPRLVHKPTMGERGDVIAAYCRAKMIRSGEVEFLVIGLPEIERARSASRGAFESVYERGKKPRPDLSKPKADSPWTTDYAAMARKTAIRRFFHGFDLTDFRLLAAAVEVDTAYEVGKRIPAPAGVTSNEPIKPPPQLSVSDEWGDDVLYAHRGEDDGDGHDETIVDASASDPDPRG